MNRIPSSCTSKNCSFTFSESETPTITSLSPAEGQSGINVTIWGHGFSDKPDDVSISIGGVVCVVIYASMEEVHCTAGEQSAGCYKLEMTIEGAGMAAIADDQLCFQYLLTVDSVSPKEGGVTGGHMITFSGEGFIQYMPTPLGGMEMRFSTLPWFRYGLGVPADSDFDLPDMMFMESRMDNETADLSDRLRYLYSFFPMSVFIGDNPCIIVESSVTSLSCVPLLSQSGSHTSP